MRKKKSLGVGFVDEIIKVSLKGKNFQNPDVSEWADSLIPNFDPSIKHDLQLSHWRLTSLVVLVLILFFVLFLRLFHLQISSGKTNRELADGNRIQVKSIHAQRGVIFDRNGKIIAANSPGFRLVDPKTHRSLFLSREQAFELEVKNDLRANNLEIDSIRAYPKGEELAHVLGYVGEISEEELKQEQYRNYRPGDRIGKSGVESFYEHLLKGKDGGEIIEIDAQGKKLRTIRTFPPKPGLNLYLAIDSDLQHEVFKNLTDGIRKSNVCCGAAIVANPSTGEILSLVSVPSFDNNIFSDTQKNDLVGDILSNKDFPILNRAISGTYPPGSTYKIISSLAALNSGKVTKDTAIEDTGRVVLGTYSFANWFFTQYGKTEGSVDLVKALQRSNDTYFYLIGQKIGEQALIDWSHNLNLGKTLGIDLFGESNGLVPDDKWKRETYNQPWYPGDTLHLSIGQGFMLTTPLQVLGYTSFIAANGAIFKPHLLSKITFEDGQVSAKVDPEILISNLVKQDQIQVIKNGLEAVTKPGGTAWPFFTFPITTAGKTGTAEFGDPKNRTHAWYTGYAPIDDPKVAMTVLIEAGGEGSSVATPIVKESFRWYFSPDKNDLIKDINQMASDSAKVLGE